MVFRLPVTVVALSFNDNLFNRLFPKHSIYEKSNFTQRQKTGFVVGKIRAMVDGELQTNRQTADDLRLACALAWSPDGDRKAGGGVFWLAEHAHAAAETGGSIGSLLSASSYLSVRRTSCSRSERADRQEIWFGPFLLRSLLRWTDPCQMCAHLQRGMQILTFVVL